MKILRFEIVGSMVVFMEKVVIKHEL